MRPRYGVFQDDVSVYAESPAEGAAAENYLSTLAQDTAARGVRTGACKKDRHDTYVCTRAIPAGDWAADEREISFRVIGTMYEWNNHDHKRRLLMEIYYPKAKIKPNSIFNAYKAFLEKFPKWFLTSDPRILY
jgi:hypothetical protein